MNSSSSGSTPISPVPPRLSRLTSSSSDATCGGAPTWKSRNRAHVDDAG